MSTYNILCMQKFICSSCEKHFYLTYLLIWKMGDELIFRVAMYWVY